MTANTTVQTTTPNQKRISSLVGRLVFGRYCQVARSLQMEAPEEFAKIIAEADPALDEGLAGEVENLLRTGGAPFVPLNKTLMPRMIDRFGLTSEHLEEIGYEKLKSMQKRCNSCANAARCWSAIRAGASAEQCREFCPNSADFDEAMRSRSADNG